MNNRSGGTGVSVWFSKKCRCVTGFSGKKRGIWLKIILRMLDRERGIPEKSRPKGSPPPPIISCHPHIISQKQGVTPPSPPHGTLFPMGFRRLTRFYLTIKRGGAPTSTILGTPLPPTTFFGAVKATPTSGREGWGLPLRLQHPDRLFAWSLRWKRRAPRPYPDGGRGGCTCHEVGVTPLMGRVGGTPASLCAEKDPTPTHS